MKTHSEDKKSNTLTNIKIRPVFYLFIAFLIASISFFYLIKDIQVECSADPILSPTGQSVGINSGIGNDNVYVKSSPVHSFMQIVGVENNEEKMKDSKENQDYKNNRDKSVKI